MYEHFKQGDFVRCTNNEEQENYLSIYKTYLVIIADADGLILVADDEGNTRWFNKVRFSLDKFDIEKSQYLGTIVKHDLVRQKEAIDAALKALYKESQHVR